jgi:uncharacterized membrane protein YfcA
MMEFFGLGLMEIAVRLVLGLLIGFCIGLTGVGGGVLVLPALTLLLKMNPVVAVGTASSYAFLTKVSATFHHIKLKTIDWTISLLFLAGALPANAAVSFWITHRETSPGFLHALKLFITGTVFFCVGVMVLNLVGQVRKDKSGGTRKTLSERIAARPHHSRILGVVMGAVVGGLIGATSIGGGVLIVPMLMILFGLEARRTVGSSIFIAVVLTLLTSLIYSKGGAMDWTTAIVMSIGSLAGVPQGSKLSVKMPDKILQGVVIALIFAAACMMIFKNGH